MKGAFTSYCTTYGITSSGKQRKQIDMVTRAWSCWGACVRIVDSVVVRKCCRCECLAWVGLGIADDQGLLGDLGNAADAAAHEASACRPGLSLCVVCFVV